MDFEPVSAQLVTEARRRKYAGLAGRERLTRWLFAVAFLGLAVPLALLTRTARPESPLLLCLLEFAFVVSSRIEFEVGSGATIPTQVVFVPMLFVFPAGLIPIAVAVGLVLGRIPELCRRELPLGRVAVVIGNAWYSLGPALVFLTFGESAVRSPAWGVILFALVAQAATDFTSSLAREWLALRISPRELMRPLLWVLMIDALLTPVGLAAALGSVVTKVALFLPTVLLGLLWLFAREHKQRLNQALELVLLNETLEERAAELRQAQKVEAIGRLASGIAHDFNNLLTVISGYSEMLLSRRGHQTEGAEELLAISNAAERGAGLTRQLLAFGRRSSLNPSALDLNATITETLTMLDRLIGEDIEVSATLAAELGTINADRGQIEQIIVNLVVNACDAMPGGGRLVVKTDNLALDNVAVGTSPDVLQGDYVQLSVADTGEGMDAATIERIFDPFFTTKEPGVGTGLGLSTVRGIVKECAGQIEVDSEPGIGTTFRLYFPRLAGNTVPLGETPLTHERSLRGSETILLVDDTEALRIMGKEILERYGYTVLLASNGTEALQLAHERHVPIDLLMTDIRMPGMDGTELAQRFIAFQPNTKILYVTGGTGSHTDRVPGALYLEKPYEIADLARTLRELLERPGA